MIYELTPSKDRLSLWKNSKPFCRLDILFPQVLWKNQFYCYSSFARLIDYSNIDFSLIKGSRKKLGVSFTCGRLSVPSPNFWCVLVDLCDHFIRPSSPLLSICNQNASPIFTVGMYLCTLFWTFTMWIINKTGRTTHSIVCQSTKWLFFVGSFVIGLIDVHNKKRLGRDAARGLIYSDTFWRKL